MDFWIGAADILSRYTSQTLTRDELLILTAVRMETRAIQRALRWKAPLVHTTGIRGWRLPEPRQLAGIRLILLCGVAGALDPTLQVGDVILDDPERRFPDSPIYRRGRIHTASQIVTTPAEKAWLFAETAALAVDMEQSIVRDYARPLGIPVVGLRAISDRADQVLDPAVIQLVDDLGGPRPMKIASTLLRRPALALYLSRLNASTKLALENLATTVAAAVGFCELPEFDL